MYYMASKKSTARIYAFLSIFLWSTSFVSTNIIISTEALDLRTVHTLKFLLASIILLFLVFILKMQIPSFMDLVKFSLCGMFGYTAYIYFLHKGIGTLPAHNIYFANALCPIMIIFLSYSLFRTRTTGLAKLGLFISMVGVIALYVNMNKSKINTGILYMLVATVFFSFYSILQKLVVKKYQPIEAMAYSLITGSIFIILMNYDTILVIKDLSYKSYFHLLYLAIFPGILGFYFWSKGIEVCHNTVDVAYWMFLLPVAAVIYSVLFLNTPLNIYIYIGLFLILLGMIIFSVYRRYNY